MAKQSKPSVNLVPVADRVIIQPLSEEENERQTDSGIIIPATVNESDDTQRGTVVAVGPGRRNDDGERMPLDEISEGDTVIFQFGEKINVDSEEYYIVAETNILAVIQ
jgi:chaperonin GroES